MRESPDTIAVDAIADRVRGASRELAVLSGTQRAHVLAAFADALERDAAAIVVENALDMDRAREEGLDPALLDRLALDGSRVRAMADAVRDVAALEDPVGEEIEHRTLENGLDLRKIRVPFGVVGVIYEARPNVTSDAAAIAIKTGNAIILRGSSSAYASNLAILKRLHEALAEVGLPVDCAQLFDPADRDGFTALIATEGSMDLLVPRGGEALKAYVYEHARVPVLAAAGGNCHVYVDESADADMAIAIVLNAKTQRPGVCNAAETLLVHAARERDLLPRLESALADAGVDILEGEEAWATEFLDLRIAVRVVDDLEAAIAHINRYGTGHSEAIVTQDPAAAERFTIGVDAAAVYVNASTRFTDGGVYGLGAEVGISTNKLHARGPIGLRELTTTKYVVTGTGQVRG